MSGIQGGQTPRFSPVRPRRARVARFWLASALSSGSSWITQVALFVTVLHHAPVATLALVELAGTLPALLCLPVAGALADRFDPRALALASMLAQTACLAGMALTVRWSLPLVTVCYAAQGVADSAWAPARQRWLYAVIEPDRRTAANAALGSVSGLMTILGAAAGGLLAVWNPMAALLIAASIQALTVPPLLALARVPLTGETPPARQSLWAEVREGIAAVRGLPLARSVVWLGVAWGFIGGGYTVLLAAYAVTVLRGGGHLLGALYLIDGLGVLLGTAVAARLPARRHLGGYALAYVAQGLAWTGMFLLPHSVTGGALLGAMRIASGVIIALDSTILLTGVPAALRGRVTSLHTTTYNAVSRLSLAGFGGMLGAVGVTGVGVATGCVSTLLGALWWVARTPSEAGPTGHGR